jgi:microcystin-dependent protein
MNEAVIGTLIKLPYNHYIDCWMHCEGQILEIEEYPTLSSLIMDSFGGDGIETFQLPDFRIKKPNGEYYKVGEIMENGEQYLSTYICVVGFVPKIKKGHKKMSL